MREGLRSRSLHIAVNCELVLPVQILRYPTYQHTLPKHTSKAYQAPTQYRNEREGEVVVVVWLARNKAARGRGFGREDLEFKCEKREMAPSPSSPKKYEFQPRAIQILNCYANSTESTNLCIENWSLALLLQKGVLAKTPPLDCSLNLSLKVEWRAAARGGGRNANNKQARDHEDHDFLRRRPSADTLDACSSPS